MEFSISKSFFTKASTCMLGIVLCMSTTPAFSTVTAENGCMQDVAGFELNCTANDVSISGVTDIVINDDGCAFPGDTVDFTATFTVVTTAKERHDIGLYFSIDGDPNGDGAISGDCSISTPDYAPNPPWLDLDGTNDDPDGILQDICGDSNKTTHNPLYPTVTFYNVPCVDDDNNGVLDLPNCTSWRQFGANNLCREPAEAFPGTPSKCRCDPDFNVPIKVPSATITVIKNVAPDEVSEPGASVDFTVTVRNDGIDPENDLTLNLLVDDIHGDLNGQGDCSVPQTIRAGQTYTCSFPADVLGNAGYFETDTVTATGTDERGNVLTGNDTATVTITDVMPLISVDKTASPTEVLEPGGYVKYTVVISNDSTASSDPVTITSLVDDIYGDLDGLGTCSVPQIIAAGGSYNCSFTEYVGGGPDTSVTDVVTASGADDEGNSVSDSDDATVNINDVVSSIELIKDANPDQVYEPGGDVTFSFRVNNLSQVDTVYINELVDNIWGDLTNIIDLPDSTCSVPQTILPGGFYSCSFTAVLWGNAGDSETNVATATGIDDDGSPVTDDDSATVTVMNMAPDASLVKDVTRMDVTYIVTVTNLSDAEDPLKLTVLNDDQFGDITRVHDNVLSTTCGRDWDEEEGVFATISPNDSWTCTFVGTVTSSPHSNVVTGTLEDDDDSAPIDRSDSATVTWE